MNAPTDDADVLEDTLYWLKFHVWRELGDRTPLDVFKRLLAKKIKAPDWKDTDHYPVARHQIRSYREKRTTEEIARLSRGHDKLQPMTRGGPIIIAVLDDQERLLDGNTRINLWISQGNTDQHDVNVHIVETTE